MLPFATAVKKLRSQILLSGIVSCSLHSSKQSSSYKKIDDGNRSSYFMKFGTRSLGTALSSKLECHDTVSCV